MSKKFVCLAAIFVTLAVAGSAGAQLGKGKVLFEYWDGISGTAVSNLTSHPNYPDKPSSSEWRDNFQSPSGRADNYGVRARAYLTPPATGEYTFWVAGDDECQLWLSTDDTAANAKLISRVPGWTGVAEWGKYPEQKSAPIALVAGKSYYIEGLMKEGGGGDSLDVGWAGPGIGNATVVLAGQYCTAFIRNPEPLFKATKPDPANGAKEVTNPLFQWTAGATAILHEVYVGTTSTLGPANFMGPWPMNMYFHVPGLTPGVTYYWRVDEVDAAGVKIIGDVWSFTVAPLEAHDPDPSDGMMGRALNVQLKWTPGQGAMKHKVFLSTDKAAVTAGDAKVLAGEPTAASFSPAGLVGSTTYYWRVDEVDSMGKVVAGPVWSFATVDPTGGAVAEYWNGANLAFYNFNTLGAPVVVKTVPNVDFSWPSGTVKGTNSPDAAIDVDYFAGRFTARLDVPVSGKYRLIESTDDGGRLFLNGVEIAGMWATGGEAEFASAELDLVAGERYLLVLEYFEATGGAAARLRWSGPGITKQAIWQGALRIPDCAISGSPRNGAVEVPQNAVLTWIPAPKAVVHTVYFGTDKAKVTAGDPTVAQMPTAEARFAPAQPLAFNTTYHWRVDEMAADGTTVPGQVWNFTTANFLVVGPNQRPLNYNNTTNPFMSQLAYDVPADLTAGGVTDLALRFQGRAAARGNVAYDAATGTYTVGGAGADIWGASDQFTYTYKALEGDGSIVARVTSVGTGTNLWAKGGVMIRETLAANSKHMMAVLTGGDGGGIAFQGRPTTGGNSSSFHGDITAKPPSWVKLTREGDKLTAYYSADGVDWKLFTDTTPDNSGGPMSNPITVPMAKTVFIGLAVTSHVAGVERTMTLDSVSTTGNVTPAGPITDWTIIDPTRNWIAPLYVAVEDQAGKIALVNHPNPQAVSQSNISTGTTVQWVYDLWRIPMSAFTGVDLKKAAKLYVGVGDGKFGGTGLMNIADVRIVKPVTLPGADAIDITMKGDALVGLPNLGVGSDALGGWPAAEVPANAIDDNVTTKFLHFNGDAEPTGFSVTPAIGATVVTGLTFTTANDTPSRDPITWEVYGSNKGADGPWALIAKGTIDDFARTLDWPRRWKTVTPIGFANSMPFTSYKVMFPTLRFQTNGLRSVPNSMQIAEVELLGTVAPAGPVVVWVSFHGADNAPSSGAKGVGFTEAADKGYTDLLKANGYNVVRYIQNNNPNVDLLNAANLVILSRSVASASFQNVAADRWNSVTAPTIITNGYLSRKSRLGFNSGSGGPTDIVGDIKLSVKDPKHPIFAGVALTGDTMTNAFAGLATYPTDKTKAAGISIVTDPANADGVTLATLSAASGAPAGSLVIAEWQAGTRAIHDGGAGTNVLGGRRLVLLTGSRENGGKSSETAGMYDLYDDGAKIFLNAVKYMCQ